jgi:hypothetical protein
MDHQQSKVQNTRARAHTHIYIYIYLLLTIGTKLTTNQNLQVDHIRDRQQSKVQIWNLQLTHQGLLLDEDNYQETKQL